jgi:hypothetical protein
MTMRILCLVLLIGLLGCKADHALTSATHLIPFYLTDFLKRQSIEDIDFKLNEDGDLIVCSQVIQNAGPPMVSYTVYDIKAEKMVYSNQFIGGNLDWHSASEIRFTTSPKNIEDHDQYMVIDVFTKSSKLIKISN